MFSSEVNSLRETVAAIRQYSENDTIDHLLGQVSEKGPNVPNHLGKATTVVVYS